MLRVLRADVRPVSVYPRCPVDFYVSVLLEADSEREVNVRLEYRGEVVAEKKVKLSKVADSYRGVADFYFTLKLCDYFPQPPSSVLKEAFEVIAEGGGESARLAAPFTVLPYSTVKLSIVGVEKRCCNGACSGRIELSVSAPSADCKPSLMVCLAEKCAAVFNDKAVIEFEGLEPGVYRLELLAEHCGRWVKAGEASVEIKPSGPRVTSVSVSAPASVAPGVEFEVYGVVDNGGDEGVCEARLYVNGEVVEARSVRLYCGLNAAKNVVPSNEDLVFRVKAPREEGVLVVQLEVCGVKSEARRVEVRAVRTPSPCYFSVAGVEAPSEVVAGSVFTVKARIVNTGGAACSRRVRVLVDEREVCSRSVALGKGEGTVVECSVEAPDAPGVVHVTVDTGDEVKSVAVSVVAPSSSGGSGSGGGGEQQSSGGAAGGGVVQGSVSSKASGVDERGVSVSPLLAAGALILIIALRARG